MYIFFEKIQIYIGFKKKNLERAFLKSDKLFKTWILTNIKVLLAVWEMLSFQLIMILGGDLGNCHLLKIHYVNKKPKKKKKVKGIKYN